MALRDVMNLEFPEKPKDLKDKALEKAWILAYDDWLNFKQAMAAAKGPFDKAQKSLKSLSDTMYQMVAFTESDPKKAKAAEQAMAALNKMSKEMRNF